MDHPPDWSTWEGGEGEGAEELGGGGAQVHLCNRANSEMMLRHACLPRGDREVFAELLPPPVLQLCDVVRCLLL